MSFSLASSANWGLQYSYGKANFAGDLSKDESNLHNFQILTLFGHANKWPLKYYLSIDSISTKVTHVGQKFPFPEKATLKILAFLFVANLCHDKEQLKWQFCAGLGQGTVNVNADHVRSDYGSWNYQLQLNYLYRPDFYFFTQTKYIGKVEIENNGVNGAFGFYTYTLGLGYLFYCSTK